MSNPLTTTPLTPTLSGGPSSPASSPPVTLSTPTPTLTTTPSGSPPTSTPPPTSTDTTASSSSTPSTTQSSSSTLSSTSSTQTSSSASTTTPNTITTTSTTPTLSPSSYTSTSDGVVVTSYAYVTASSTPSSSNNTAASSTSFFSNTGAVAGVFTVVGLIVVAIFVALVTNAVRRRRAKKFDRDVAEAAAEAAASSRSPFDDYTYSNNGGSGGGGGGGGYPYSDTTHGTFAQAPMGLPSDTYGMSEMTQYDPYAAGAVSLATANVGRARSRHDSESQRTPGIAGVGAGNLAREPSRRAPYHAFAGPGPQPHELLDHTPSGRYRPRGVDLLEGAGLGGTGVAAMATANNGAFINRRPSEYTHQTHGSMRSQGHSSNENYPAPLQPAYQPPPRNDTHFADAYTGFADAPSPQPPLSPGFHNSHETSPSPPPAQSHSPVGDNEGEDYEDEYYGQHNRVLRVANE